MKPWEKTDSLEFFLHKQERLIKQDERYKKLIIIPLIVIAASISVLAYNLTVGKRINSQDTQGSAAVTGSAEETATIAMSEKINLNTATADMLDSLPGIGIQKAEAIVEMRERMGGFRSAQDILNVDGIGERILAEIQYMIYVEKE